MVAKMMLTLAVLAWQTIAGDAFMPPAAATAPAGAALGAGFVANRGQAASPILFSGRSGHGRVACTRESIILDLPSADRCGGVAVALQFAGANPAAVRGDGAGVAVANYLRSADRNCWVTNVPVYQAVRHVGLYAGIDLVTRQAAAGLKLDFAVAPGADPGSIRMRYAGCERIRLDAQGALVMETPLGEVVDAAPMAYQSADGACRWVDIRYDLAPDGTICFSVGPYDRTQTLTIDPLLAWSTFLGGSLSDHAEDVTSDASGDIYVTGHTFSNTDFPVTPGAYQTAFGGAPRDAFVAKISADGSSLIWCTYLGGTGSNGEEGSSVSVAADGTVWIGGRTMSSDFPTTAGAFDQTYNGGVQVGDAYAALLSADGASLLYGTFLGGAAEEWAWGIEARNGLAYIAGFTSSPTFPTTPGAYDQTYNGVGAQFVGDAFLAVINPAGAGSSDLVYGSFIGGASDDGARGITVDASGAAHITGSTTSSGFPTTAGACQTSLAGASDAFVAIIAPLGGGATDLVYATYLGGAANDGGLSLDLDASGHVYLGGLTASATDFPITPGACQSIFAGGTYDAFAAEITPAGGGAADLLYSTYLGGSGDETGEGDGVYLAHSGTGIRVSENGCGVYLHTITQSTDFPTTPGAYDRTFNGQDDAVLVKMMFAGQGAADLLYGTYLGGGGEEHWFGITVTSREDVAIACGSTSVDYPNSSIPSDYPTTAGSFQPTFGGGNEDAAITVCGFTDYGDAPDTYGTLESSNGPRHILGQLRLGIAWDAEPDGAPGGSAAGDDLLADWPDDEDGVMLLGSGPPGGPYALPYQAGQNGAVRVTVTGIPPGLQAWLAAWFDWNGNGVFENPGERAFFQAATALVDTVDFSVPAGATAGTVFSRFRLAWNGNDIENPTSAGPVCDGEVEDYAVVIIPVELGSFEATQDGDGVLITWTTHSECENLGFHLYRSPRQAGPYDRISDLIPGAGTSAGPHAYSYRDHTTTPGLTCWYELADVTTAGVETLHGPVCAGGLQNQGIVLLDVPAPHPIVDQADVRFVLPARCPVTLTLCDFAGRALVVIAEGIFDTGAHVARVDRAPDGHRYGSGSYLVRLATPFGVRTRAVVFAE